MGGGEGTGAGAEAEAEGCSGMLSLTAWRLPLMLRASSLKKFLSLVQDFPAFTFANPRSTESSVEENGSEKSNVGSESCRTTTLPTQALLVSAEEEVRGFSRVAAVQTLSSSLFMHSSQQVDRPMAAPSGPSLSQKSSILVKGCAASRLLGSSTVCGKGVCCEAIAFFCGSR